jgi:hypothetical protein
MVSAEQIITWVSGIAAVILGGGGIAALIVAFANRKIGLKTTENEANKTINVTWEAIVDDLQTQIKDGREEFKQQLTAVYDKLTKLEERVQKQDVELHIKDRLLVTAIGHIIRLELLVPPNPVPPRPEGLE